ncbi:MAG TPA: di-heme oxidoredictase family protein [Candidatus Sulfotelmatobacter sp.]
MSKLSFSSVPLLLLFAASIGSAQVDPGVQTASRGTGATIIDPANDPNGFTAFFNDGLTRFQEVESVSNAPNTGLGPRFNSNQCSSCHAQPAIGGSGAGVNPQFVFISTGVAPGDTMPSFITANGPTIEARAPFFLNSSGGANTQAPNGGVEDLFTVTGRSDAGSCSVTQPDFTAYTAANDLIFRIPTPTYGEGLIENLDDSTLMANQAKNLQNTFGIAGSFNRSGNDGTIMRYGWKAQNKSLHVFSGEAYNVEMGISNELFPQDRPLPEEEVAAGLPATCLNLSGSGYPEDRSNPTQTTNAAVLDDVSAFANFMRFLAPPLTGPVVLKGTQVPAGAIKAGGALFSSVGCATCHSPSPGTTQVSNFAPALSNVPVNAYSDLEIHNMGIHLADNVTQGSAGGDQFRTAPLWGLGQRIFLMHDGRTTNLVTAIEDHRSSQSEATSVIGNYNKLTPAQQQDLLDFLRSL